MMEHHGVLSLPVERDGVVTYSVTRHDLLRARLGLGVGWGIDPVPEQATKKFAWALARGKPNREQIALTVLADTARELI
jgi:hypothetical protein